VLAVSGLASWASIAFAYYYLEKTLYLTPCNLCMMQRLAFALIGFFFLLDAIFWPTHPAAPGPRPGPGAGPLAPPPLSHYVNYEGKNSLNSRLILEQISPR